MKKLMLLAALLTTSCTVQTTNYPVFSESSSYAVQNPVIRVRHTIGAVTNHGTGVIICRSGQIMVVSAYHVFEDYTSPEEIRFLTQDRKPIKCKITKVVPLPAHDTMVIYVSDLSPKIKPMSVGTAKLRDKGAAMGYPKDGKFEVHSGFVNSERIQFKGTVKSGMSGGPLVVNGKVVGLASTRTLDESAGEFVPLEKVLELLK